MRVHEITIHIYCFSYPLSSSSSFTSNLLLNILPPVYHFPLHESTKWNEPNFAIKRRKLKTVLCFPIPHTFPHLRFFWHISLFVLHNWNNFFMFIVHLLHNSLGLIKNRVSFISPAINSQSPTPSCLCVNQSRRTPPLAYRDASTA